MKLSEEPKWTVQIGNEVDKDERYHEFYCVSGPTREFRCENEDDAKWLCNILNKYFENI